jgi:hypothetical protein
MSPHYTSVRDGNVSTVPENYRSKNYEPRSFRIKEVKDEKDSNPPDGSSTSAHAPEQGSLFTTVVEHE